MKFGKKLQTELKKQLDSGPVYNDKYLKAKIKYYNEKINPHFDNNEIPKKVLNSFVYQQF